MIPRIGQVFLVSTSLMMVTVGCQRAADDGAEQKPLSKDEGAEQKPLSKTEAAKYRQVSVKVTGLT